MRDLALETGKYKIVKQLVRALETILTFFVGGC
jgi:hypothetical protein